MVRIRKRSVFGRSAVMINNTGEAADTTRPLQTMNISMYCKMQLPILQLNNSLILINHVYTKYSFLLLLISRLLLSPGLRGGYNSKILNILCKAANGKGLMTERRLYVVSRAYNGAESQSCPSYTDVAAAYLDGGRACPGGCTVMGPPYQSGNSASVTTWLQPAPQQRCDVGRAA